MLLKQIKSLPKYNMPLSRVGVYTTDDNMMCLNMFTFGEHSDTSARTIDDSHPILELASKVAAGEVEFEGVDKDAVSSEMMKEYMAKCGSGYLNNSVGRRFLNQMGLYNAVTGSEGVEVSERSLTYSTYTTSTNYLRPRSPSKSSTPPNTAPTASTPTRRPTCTGSTPPSPIPSLSTPSSTSPASRR